MSAGTDALCYQPTVQRSNDATVKGSDRKTESIDYIRWLHQRCK